MATRNPTQKWVGCDCKWFYCSSSSAEVPESNNNVMKELSISLISSLFYIIQGRPQNKSPEKHLALYMLKLEREMTRGRRQRL